MGPSRLVVLSGIALAAVACGPSFQAVYECDVHFEHCYALDQRVASPEAKKDCWREWLHGYTYGQSRDRVEYAAMRFSALSLDPTLPIEDRGEPRPARPMAAPAPTSAFAPPPSVAEKNPVEVAATTAPSASASSRAHPVSLHAPGEECTEACSANWNHCKEGCKAAACDACDKTYRACVPACFAKR